MAIDPRSRTWEHVRAWAREQSDTARRELESEISSHTPEKDAGRRRTLALMQQLLDLETKPDE